ncbi:5-(carboxyamino)imidazole ribonucleotide synthase [Magnetospira sp. QH-2]|uniref:5-(carboxyamino)imidazole ribonucleotide synthase n=1 Tax=Magnetospira sp. (strain QH-2) TaxID=1288970 RepID=UPI0003E80F01|nr:5-(carboxyamino)imidazole ribonucleotide synthase [Magnetospira sp. QH-2]CCQ74372.1 Phosphoribosylaminoimidazole carboxylase ATPase subunit (AIR carboxylase) (AIRC) [Magnetospira sp. QH-2]
MPDPIDLKAPLPPGSTIGIIGGGQLGRMSALAAARLGLRSHIFCQQQDNPGAQVADVATVAAFDDLDALGRFADAVDVVTFEFENIPHQSVQHLAERVCVRPNWESLHTCQHRIVEKDFLNAIGVATAPYRRIDGPRALAKAADELGCPSVLKTCMLGYDGKGQVLLRNGQDAEAAWSKMGGGEGVLEGFVAFEREISVIIARGSDGAIATFDPVENIHTHHILDRTIAPAPINKNQAKEAQSIAHHIAEKMNFVGLLAVEMFVTEDGRLLVNELAPRPHNSGHWTIDACITSQFEQFVRAVCGLPLGSPMRHSDAEMRNLLGDDVNGWLETLKDPAAKLHLYGKAEARPGRKMGHVTWIKRRG